MDPLKMYFLLKMVIFHCYVTLPKVICYFRGDVVSQWLMGGLGWWFGFLGSPYERDCYVGAPLESQTTNPSHPSTISWCGWPLFRKNWTRIKRDSVPRSQKTSRHSQDDCNTWHPCRVAGFQNWNRWIEWKCLIFLSGQKMFFSNQIRTLGDTCVQIRGAVSQRSTVLGTLSSGRQRLMGYTSRTLIGIHGWFDDDGLNRTKVRYMSFLCLLLDPQHSHGLGHLEYLYQSRPTGGQESWKNPPNKKPWWWEILVNLFRGNLAWNFEVQEFFFELEPRWSKTQPDCKKVREV